MCIKVGLGLGTVIELHDGQGLGILALGRFVQVSEVELVA
jgi:hypothetical protein